MQCQILFSGKNKKKNISKCRLLKILPRVLSVKQKKKSYKVTMQLFFFFQINRDIIEEKRIGFVNPLESQVVHH